jgi:hypothetical protein
MTTINVYMRIGVPCMCVVPSVAVFFFGVLFGRALGDDQME